MFRLALKSVRHNPKRLILTAVAVALGVALVAATFTFTNAFSQGFHQMFSDIYSKVDVIVEADPDAEVDPLSKEGLITAADLDAIRGIDGVAAAEGGIGYEMGALLNKAGDAPLKQGPPTILFNWTGNADIDNVTLIEGRAPAADGELVVDIDTFPLMDIELGDGAIVATETGLQEVTIVGTVRFGEDNNTQTAVFVMGTEATVREIGGGLTGYRSVSVIAEEGASADDLTEALSGVVPSQTRAITSQDKAAEQSEGLDDALDLVNVFAVVFGLVALFVGAYIIVNTFRIIVTQRTREFGLLRAIGAKGSDVRAMILFEAVIVGIVAAGLGVGAGWLLALAGAALTELASGDMFGAVVLPIEAVIWGLGLGLAVTLVAAILPAIHASRISPMEALREAGTAGKKPLKLRNLVGGALALAGVGSVAVGLYVSVARPYIWVGVGAVLVVLGVTLLAAQVLVPMAYGLRGVLESMWGVNGKLAANNIRREPRRSANTAAALMIGVMLLALVATFSASIKDTFTSQLSGIQAELLVQSRTAPVPAAAVEIIGDTAGVQEASRFALDTAEVDGIEYSLGTIDADTYGEVIDLPTDAPLTDIDGGVFISPTLVTAGYEVGDVLTVVGAEDTLDLTVTGLYLNEGDNDLLVEWQTGTELVGEPSIVTVLIKFEEGADAGATEQAIKDNLSTTFPLVQPESPGALQDFFDKVLNLVLGVITALLGAALVVAILGVANTLLLSVTERTREIGLLRAVGVRRRSVWSMITIESVVMAVFGTLLGIILGVSLGAAVVGALSDFGFERAVVPWAWIGIYTILSMIAGVLAAVWPAWRASRLDILEAVAADG